jgi:hypothetical protein
MEQRNQRTEGRSADGLIVPLSETLITRSYGGNDIEQDQFLGAAKSGETPDIYAAIKERWIVFDHFREFRA